MNVLVYLIPIALFMGALGLIAFLWSLRSNQYDDLDGEAERILFDERPARGPGTASRSENQTNKSS